MKIVKVLFIGFLAIIFLNGCDNAKEQDKQPIKEILDAAPPLPPK